MQFHFSGCVVRTKPPARRPEQALRVGQLGYLIPYSGKVQFQISWRGLVQRAYETGCVRAFCGEIVYEHDKFDRQYAPKRNLFHAPAGGDRREEIGAYALVEFKDGTIDWEYADIPGASCHPERMRGGPGLLRQ